MPIAQKIQALKGATIGAATVGGAPAQVVRYLLRQNNMKPDSDVRFAAVGAGQARVNALKNGQVDMIVGGIPDTEQPELEGWGFTLIRLGGEIEIFKDYPHESVHALDTYIKAHPDSTRALLRAIARGNNLIIDNPGRVRRSAGQAISKNQSVGSQKRHGPQPLDVPAQPAHDQIGMGQYEQGFCRSRITQIRAEHRRRRVLDQSIFA